MQRAFGNGWFAANVLIYVVLIGAETAAIGHPAAHEQGAVYDVACASCAMAAQLAAACPTAGASPDRALPEVLLWPIFDVSVDANFRLPVRQRGPPTSR